MADKESPREGQGEQFASSYRKAGPFLDASWQLVGAVGLWTLVGWWLDGKLHTGPWLLVGGAVLGMIVGFYLFFRAITAIGQRKP